MADTPELRRLAILDSTRNRPGKGAASSEEAMGVRLLSFAVILSIAIASGNSTAGEDEKLSPMQQRFVSPVPKVASILRARVLQPRQPWLVRELARGIGILK